MTSKKNNGVFNGYGRIDFHWNNLENPSLREYLKFTGKGPDGKDRSGILVSNVQKLSSAHGKLLKDDVVVAINGHKIGDDGTIELPYSLRTQTNQRVHFRWVSAMSHPGDKCKLTVFRKGERKELEVEVQKLDNHNRICPVHVYDIKPTYYVWAGLVFTHLTLPLLRHEFGSVTHGPSIMCHKAFYSKPEQVDERIVIIPTILDHPINISYENSHKWVMVKSVNGQKVTNCKQVMDIIEASKDEFIRIDCVETGPIVMKKELADKANQEIMRTHSVYSLKSEDLGGKFPSLGGNDDSKTEEQPGFEAVLEGFENLHAQGTKLLDQMGIPKNGPTAKAALSGLPAGPGGESDLLSFLANARCVLDEYKKARMALTGGPSEEENESKEQQK